MSTPGQEAAVATERAWLTHEEAQAHTGLGRPTLDTAIKSGALRVSKVGGHKIPGRLLFKREWLDAWLESLANGGDEPLRDLKDAARSRQRGLR